MAIAPQCVGANCGQHFALATAHRQHPGAVVNRPETSRHSSSGRLIPYLFHELLHGRLCHVLAHVPICVVALPKVKGVWLVNVLMTCEFAYALRLVLHLLLGEDYDLQPGLVLLDGCHGDEGLCPNVFCLTHCQVIDVANAS